jgi:carboxypeptidase C (cathepsin A)
VAGGLEYLAVMQFHCFRYASAKKDAVIPVLRLFSVAVLAVLVEPGVPSAQNQRLEPEQAGVSGRVYPAELQNSTTHHVLDLPGRKIEFAVTAGSFVLTTSSGLPRAEVSYLAYRKDGSEPARRPVAFIMNGGPGASSAYLNLIAIGPWRIRLGDSRYSASLSNLTPNAETWLDFSDLVFIDPPGTGYSRVIGDEQAQEYLHSVSGDIDSIASVIQRWLRENERLQSPTFFVGASYGGFRGPLLARKLQIDKFKSFSGLILISPVLDFSLLHHGAGYQKPWVSAASLPSLAAAWAERNSSLSLEILQQAEAYASGEYISDLMRGVEDAKTVERIAQQIEKLTGTAPDSTRLSKGHVDVQAYQRDLGQWPVPNAASSKVHVERSSVQLLEDYTPEKITGALNRDMREYLGKILNHEPRPIYRISHFEQARHWRWNNGPYGVESLSRLRQALDADKGMRVLIAHGTSDLTTPYYATKVLSAQIDAGQPSRLDFKLYGGNHVFYTREASRKALRADAQAFFEHGQSAQIPSHR